MTGECMTRLRVRLRPARIPTGLTALAALTVALATAACAENDAAPPRSGPERSAAGEAMYQEGASVDVGYAPADAVIDNGEVSFGGTHDIPEALITLPEECALAIGNEGADGEVFDGVTGIVLIEDSVIAVADRGHRDVRFFTTDSSGRLLGRVGGQGEGPGDFRDIRSLAEHPDGVVAHDVALQRVTTIRWPELEVETQQFQDLRDVTAGMGGSGPALVGTLGDGRLVFQVQERGMMGPADDGTVVVDTSRIVLWNGEERSFETIVRLEEPGKLATQLPDGRIFYGQQPFSVPLSIAAQGDLLVFGTGTAPRIEARWTDRPVVRHVVWEDGSPDVSEEVIQSYRDRMMPADEVRREAFETLLTAEELPDRLPAYERIVVDSRERMWVDEYMLPWDRMAGEGNRWLVFDDGGAVLGRLSTTELFRVYAANEEFVYGTARSQLGVGYVCAIELPEWER